MIVMSNKAVELSLELLYKEGFALAGILHGNDCHFGDWLSSWLSKGYQADMHWMKHHKSIRENPSQIESYCKSIISAAISYHTPPPQNWAESNPISNYAWGDDYHLVVKKKLNRVIDKLREEYPKLEARAFVDTAPLPEKLLAMRCGLGWIGKNGMLINRRYGSYLFLGEIITNLDLPSRIETAKDYCGSCRKCIEACPTKAIVADGIIDSNRCISYLTIEKRGDFTDSEQKLLKHQVFGCDICQQVCPWNKKAVAGQSESFRCADKWQNLKIDDFANLTREQFNKLKIKSPLKRAKYEGIVRNAKAIVSKGKSK